MLSKVLVLGAYGTFGSKITRALMQANISVIASGRNLEKLKNLELELSCSSASQQDLKTECIDINDSEFSEKLKSLSPKIVINTCGPFVENNYNVAQLCISEGINYIDLADNRQFVCGFKQQLDQHACANNVIAITGASTVPALSSAVLEEYKSKFSTIDSVIYGISPGQKSPRGLATTKSILSYLGKAFSGHTELYGWQGLYVQQYPTIGKRLMGYCDIPDLDLFPQLYNINNIRFSAGMESKLLHICIWLYSWLVRCKIIKNPQHNAQGLLNISHLFDFLGTDNGGMHMLIQGQDHNSQALQIKWFLEAKNGSGPNIPAAASVILAKKILNNELQQIGAMPCVGLIKLNEYVQELNGFEIQQYLE